MNKEKSTWNGIWDKLKDVTTLAVAAKKLELDKDCVATLAEAQKKLFADKDAYTALKAATVALMEGDEETLKTQIKAAAEKSGLSWLTAFAILLINAIPLLQKVYEDKGYSPELMWDTLIDIRCKLREEHDLSGVWGTGAIAWYIRIYRAAIIKLGRLEFEPIAYKWETPYRHIQKGDPVMNMHIPSTGPMLIEDVLDAFQRAYRFFGYKEPMPVMAASWLLYPPVCQLVMKPGSNLRNFYELFDVVESYEDPDNKNFWRIFNMEWEEGVLDKVPLDTSLRKNLHAFMKPGVNMGVGRCMLLFDGEKVISLG